VGEAPQILEKLKDLTVTVPAKVIMECSISRGDPQAEIHWYKDAKEIYSGNNVNLLYKDKVAVCAMDKVELSDAGWYRCEAVNKLGRVETQCTLTVNAKPKLDYEDRLKDTVSTKAGASIILSVNVSGFPIPKVTWFHKGEEINSSMPGVTIESEDDFSRLTIKPAAGEHSGSYKVKAENKVGEDEAEFTASVKDKPSSPLKLRVKEVSKDYVVVAWDVPENDGGSPITGYTVEKKDVKKTSFMNAGRVDANSLEMKVNKLVEGNEYYFRVAAENAIGESDWATMDEPVKARLPFGE
jgi:hypothetical protein